MYLNIFEKEKVLEVLNFLKENNSNDILFNDSTLDNHLNEEFFLKLSYFSAMHRVDVNILDLSEPLYSNKDCISSLCSKEKFIEIVTNGKFKY